VLTSPELGKQQWELSELMIKDSEEAGAIERVKEQGNWENNQTCKP